MLAEVELDPVGLECAAQRVAQRLRLARQHVVHALDQRHRGAHAPHGLGHLHAHRPAAQHEQAARHLGEAGCLAIRPDAVELAQARDGRYHRVRAGRDHDVVGGMRLLVDLHAAGAGQPGGAAQHLDPLRLEVLRLGAVLVARHHEVAPSERALGVDAAAHGLARARRLARRLERLARAEQRLRRDAGPVVALAADPLRARRWPRAGRRRPDVPRSAGPPGRLRSRSRRSRSRASLPRLVDLPRCGDQADMAERLREVAELLAVLLCRSPPPAGRGRSRSRPAGRRAPRRARAHPPSPGTRRARTSRSRTCPPRRSGRRR